MKIKNLELIERREDDIAMLQTTDKDLYRVEKIVWAEKGDTPELPEFRSINYAEVSFPLTTAERVAKEQHLINTGQTSAAQLLWDSNPDGFASLEEAEERINKNRGRVTGRSPFSTGVDNGGTEE